MAETAGRRLCSATTGPLDTDPQHVAPGEVLVCFRAEHLPADPWHYDSRGLGATWAVLDGQVVAHLATSTPPDPETGARRALAIRVNSLLTRYAETNDTTHLTAARNLLAEHPTPREDTTP